jgi:hypothetical protein
LLEVYDDRFQKGIQQFHCRWWGSSPDQWVTGKDLECNQKLEDYARKSGKKLNWDQLEGGPSGTGATAHKPRMLLDWERTTPQVKRKSPGESNKAPRKLRGEDAETPESKSKPRKAPSKLQGEDAKTPESKRSSAPRVCKFKK